MASALQRSDVIILCGGLGPTEDDRHPRRGRPLLNRPLSVDADILEALRRKFADRGFPMAKINERQAEVIQGAEVLDNPLGTAPGMWIEEKGANDCSAARSSTGAQDRI